MAAAVASVLAAATLAGQTDVGVRDPAWAPDGDRVAVSLLDSLYVIDADGGSPRAVTRWPETPPLAERDPAWSPDGQRLAFAADRGDGFDLFVIGVDTGRPEAVTNLPGDERWPSWTTDGALVFAHRPDDRSAWDLFITEGSNGDPAARPRRLAATTANETEPRVSPDGRRLLLVSDQGDSGEPDLRLLDLAALRLSDAGDAGALLADAERVAPGPGREQFAQWAPAGDRVAFHAERQQRGSVWVVFVAGAPDAAGRSLVRPDAPAVLVSRSGGAPTWSPDGQTILIAELPERELTYNGDPERLVSMPPPLFGGGRAFRLKTLPAPRPPDAGARPITVRADIAPDTWARLFDRTWQTLADLYYHAEPGRSRWRRLGDELRPRALEAGSEADFERVVDDLVSRQPLVGREVRSRGALVVSGHPLASAAGVAALDAGGNVADAAVAVSFALGVVEPDASGIGGDGMAILFLAGMDRPTIIDFKDQTPAHATLDNPAIVDEGRIVADGAAAANIPGLVGGLGYLYERYGSGRLPWAALVEPAIELAEDGFVLDEALPTTIAAGRALFERHEAARKIFLPDGRVPKPGDRFVNADLGATLRTLAEHGAEAFYTGALSRRIAADLRANGGIIGEDDLAQYRAIERDPVAGRYRGHLVFSSPPPVATGTALIETLQILEHYEPDPETRPYFADADYLHYLVEAWKARDATLRAADPARWPVNVEEHVEARHAAERFAVIRSDRAGTFPRRAEDERRKPGRADRIGRGTTAFVVADTAGNVIAVTETLSTWGGAFYVSDGLGFLYNNHLRSNGTEPGEYGQLLPLVRSSTTSAPTLLFREVEDRLVPTLAVAAAGNAWITGSVYDIITNVVDAGLSIQAAVEAPRFLVERDPADANGRAARIQIEDRFPGDLLAELRRRGHVFQKIGRKGELRYGYSAAVLLDRAAGVVIGGVDPRRSHAAIAKE